MSLLMMKMSRWMVFIVRGPDRCMECRTGAGQPRFLLQTEQNNDGDSDDDDDDEEEEDDGYDDDKEDGYNVRNGRDGNYDRG